ncbi:MAG: ABC transporter substrate-binding protein [Bacteroidales bacterium]|nr:ABC transporter substrate-binding protein [Bacteroidales bacterium]
MNKKTFLVTIVILIVIGGIYLVSKPKDYNSLKLGIFLYTEHKVIDEINTGFKNALSQFSFEDSLVIIEKNANGDQLQLEQIAEHFINGDYDAIFVVGAPAIKILKDKQCKKPVIFGGPPFPVKSGFVPSLINHNTNFTGTTYSPPTEAILDIFLESFDKAKKIAVLRNPSEPNSEAVSTSFMKNAIDKKISIVDLPSMDGASVDASLRSLTHNKVDGLFIPTDNLVYSMLDKVIQSASEMDIPVFSCTKISVQKGALFSLGTDYETVGELSAPIAASILNKSKSPNEIDVLEIKTGKIYLNIRNNKAPLINENKLYKIEVVK